MKTIESNHNVTNSVQFETLSFGIKSKNLGHIVHILRDQIYSDKPLAVIREYSTNAMDANIDAGRPNTPIIVTLPSKLDPTLKIRDNGHGLNKQQIEDIYLSYGESTKRNSNNTVGQLGLGCKAALCYSDNFIVASFNNGIKTVYDMVVDKSNVGSCIILCSEAMRKTDVEGIEISINIKKDDIEQFREKALRFFKWWTIKPTLIGFTESDVTDVKKTILFSGTDWTIYESNNRGWDSSASAHALMGNIAYPIDWDNVRIPTDKTEIDNLILNYIKRCEIVINFKIGDIQFAPSREALQYTDFTNASINKMVRKIMSEIESVITARFTDCKNLWEAKQLFGTLFGFTDTYGELSALKNHFTNKGVSWNGIKIDRSNINNFNQYDVVAGYSLTGHNNHTTRYTTACYKYPVNPVLHLYRETGTSGMIKCMVTDDIECKPTAMVMLYDITKHKYVRKACRYLLGKNSSIKRIYVLDFKGNLSLQNECLTKQGLDGIPIVKYSDIMDDVKKSIVRITGGNRVVRTRVGNTDIRVAKYTTCKEHIYYNKWSKRSNNAAWTQVDVNVKNDAGYYVELKNNDIFWNRNGEAFSAIQRVNQMIVELNNLGICDIKKIYGFGNQILKTRNFNTKNWIRVDDFITAKINDIVNCEAFKWKLAFNALCDSHVLPSWSVLKLLAEKITDTTSPVLELWKLESKCNKYDNISVLLHTLRIQFDYKSEAAKLETLINAIKIKYPMLLLSRTINQHDDINMDDITVISNYINSVDVKNNKKQV